MQAELAELRRRIDALEAAAAPSFTPLGGMKIDPSGAVSYDFDGHVSADGVDLQAGANATPPSDRRVRWLRQSDGSVVADVYSYESGGSTSLQLRARDLGGGAIADMYGGGVGLSLVDNPATDEFTMARLTIPGLPGAGVLLMNALGESDFVGQTPGSQTHELRLGYDGLNINVYFGSDFVGNLAWA